MLISDDTLYTKQKKGESRVVCSASMAYSAFGLSPPVWRQVIPVSTTLALLLAILPRNEIVFAISKCASR